MVRRRLLFEDVASDIQAEAVSLEIDGNMVGTFLVLGGSTQPTTRPT